MEKKTCSIDGCEKPVYGRGLCRSHYVRAWKRGELGRHPARGQLSLRERVEPRIRKDDPSGCWLWPGGHNRLGYAVLRVDSRGPNSRIVRLHREVLSWQIGVIPSAMHVDHVCHNTGCVNPAHLRVVTNKQNTENLGGLPCDNTSGFLGVRRRPSGRWYATATHHGRHHYGGDFDTPEEAGEAARRLRLKLFTHNDHDRAVA